MFAGMETNTPIDRAEAAISDTAAAGREHRWLTLTTLCLAVLVAQIDTAVVHLATHAIGDHLRTGINALQWIVDSYNLVYAVLLLTSGLLADLYGWRRIFMAGAGIFTAASLLCAAAPSASILIAGRALAGLGAGLFLPASLAIIRMVWPEPVEHGRVLGIWAACNGLATAIGPTLGGLLIDRFGWRSIFLVVVPIIMVALMLAFQSVPESSDPQGRHFDGVGQLLGATALGGFALAAIQSREAPLLAIVAFIAAVLALALFIRVEKRKGQAALVPLDLFRSPTFCGAATATAGMTFGMYGVLFLLPLVWLGTGRLDAFGAGLALVPMALVLVAVSPFSSVVTERYGTRPAVAGGVAIIGAGLLLIGAGTDAASIVPSEVGLMLTGLGMGLATGPLMGTAIGAVPAARSGTASALINAVRMVGATIGVAILGAFFAMVGGGTSGLRTAMFAGGAIQIACAAIAWRAMRPPRVAWRASQ